jgi:hypothetical protein
MDVKEQFVINDAISPQRRKACAEFTQRQRKTLFSLSLRELCETSAPLR